MATFWDASPPLEFINEADVEQRLVLPLLHALGYEPEDVVPKPPVGVLLNTFCSVACGGDGQMISNGKR
jgi:hypothetical protein